MKSTLLLALMAVLLIVPSFSAMAQDPGIPDTVRLGCPVNKDSVIFGDSIALPVYLFNDEPISGLSFGFIKDSSAVKFHRFVKNTAVIPADWIFKAFVADTVKLRPHAQSIMFGGADISAENPIPAVAGSTGQLLGTMYLLIQPGATAETINIDSSFIPPAGRWEATYIDADGNILPLSPQYSDCGDADIIVGEGGQSQPWIVSVNPTAGYPGESLWVSIVGRNTHFGQGSSTVWFSQSSPAMPPIYADSVAISSPTTLSARFAIPLDAPTGFRDVSVQNSGDTSAVVRSNGFFISEPPRLDRIVPDSAYPGDMLQVSITGISTNFQQSSSPMPTAQARLVHAASEIQASSTHVVSPTLLTAWFEIPADTYLGLWDVVVEAVGNPLLTLANGFRIHDDPVLLSVVPTEARRGHSLWVTFLGRSTHFDQGGLEAAFLSRSGDSITADSITVISANQLKAFFNIPEESTIGLWDATVRQSGFPELTLKEAFLVKGGPPEISTSPASLSDSLLSSQTATHPLVITNLGGEPLQFRATVTYDYGLRELARKCLDGVTMTGTKSDSGKSQPTFTPSELEQFKANLAKYETAAKQPDAYRHSARFAIVGDYRYDVIYYLMSDSMLVSRYLFFVVDDYSNYASIQAYDALVVAEYHATYVSANEAASIRNFYDHRRPVLMGVRYLQNADEAVRSALFPVFGITAANYLNYSDTQLNPSNPITQGVQPFQFYYWTTALSVAGAEWICRNTLDQDVAVNYEGTGRTVLFSTSLHSIWSYGSPLLVANAIDWLIHGNGWLAISPDSGTVAPLSNVNLDVLFNPRELSTGDYAANIMIASNDSIHPEIGIPVSLHVTGVSSLRVSQDTVHFGNVFVGGVGADTLILYNEGSRTLTVSELSSSDSVFSVGMSDASINPRDSLLLPLAFRPSAPGAAAGSLTFKSDDPVHPIMTIVLDGYGEPPPVLAISPSSLADTLLTGDTSAVSMTISNSGSADLTWQIEIESAESKQTLDPNAQDQVTPLEEVLQSLDQNYQLINSIIPNRFDFSDGETGYYIGDGGSDMYDGGNFLETNLVEYNSILYSNDSISYSNLLGAGGKYFTRKFPGLFVFVADLNQIESFTIDGYLGANGSGSADGAVLQVHAAGTDFLGFVKRVYNASDPSVNHLIIVEYSQAVKDSFSTNTNYDFHRVSHLSGATRLYYLLYAGNSGKYIDNNATRGIMEAFLNSIGLAPGWVTVEPESGSVPAGGETRVRAHLDAASLEGGVYQAALVVSSNDPLQSEVRVPTTLFVTSAPDMELSSTNLAFDSVFVGDQRQDTLIVRNRGTAILSVADISSSLSDFVPGPDHLSVAPGDSAVVTVTFLPTSAGDIAAALTIISNDLDQFQIQIPLAGVGVLPPGIVVTPSFLTDSLKTDETATTTLTVANTGAYRLDFRADVSYSEKLQGLAFKCVEGISLTERETADGKSINGLSPADSAKFEARLLEFYDEVKRLPGSEDIPIVAVVGGQSSQTLLSLMADSSLSRDYLFYRVYNYSSYSLLKSYDGVIVSESYASIDTNQAGALADFVRADKPVLMAAYNMSNLPVASKAILLPTFGVSATGSEYYYPGGDSLNRDNPITKGITNFSLGNSGYYTWFTLKDADWIFSGHNGRYHGVSNERQGRTVLFGVDFQMLWYPSSKQLVSNAIRWMMRLGWVALDQWSGSVAPGDSLAIGVTFKSRDLVEGDHQADILFSSNVPEGSPLTVPARLHVTGIPDIFTPDSTVDFGTMFVAATKVESLLVINRGSASLRVAAITAGDPDVVVVADSFTLAPHDTQTVVLSYTPTVAGQLHDTLRIVSNDPDQPLFKVPLRATAVDPPKIAWTPDSITDSASTSDTATAVLTLSNTGSYPLNYEIGLEYPLPESLVFVSSEAGGSPTKQLLQKASTAAFADREDTIKIAVVGDDSYYVWNRLRGDAYLSSHYIFDNVGNYSNYENLASYDGLIVADYYYYMTTYEALVVSQFFNSHRPVFVGMSGLEYISNELKAVLFPVLGIQSAASAYYSWGALNPRSSITANIGIVNYNGSGTWFILSDASSADWIFADSYGHYFGVSSVGASRSVTIGAYLSAFWYYGDQKLIANAIDWMFGRIGWISAKPMIGTIAAGKTANVTLSLLGTMTNAGDFSAVAKIANNDPVNPLVTIPVHFRVTGVPEITVSDTLVDFGTAFTGTRIGDELTLWNGGTCALAVSQLSIDDSSFSVDTTTFVLEPRQEHKVQLAFSPHGAGPASGTLSIHSDDPDQPVLTVHLLGVGQEPPDILVDPLALDIALGVGETTAQILSIANLGVTDLHYNLSVAPVTLPSPLASDSLAGAGPGALGKISASGTVTATGASDIRDVVIFADDIEGNVDGWTIAVYEGCDLWHVTSRDRFSGTKSWWCGIEAQGNYSCGKQVKTAIISPPIDLTNWSTPLALVFHESFSTEWDYDYCMVDISTDGGVNWEPLRGRYGEAPSGYSYGWITTSLDISGYRGNVVKVRFYFDTRNEYYNSYPGWFVDDVSVVAVGSAPITLFPSEGSVSAGDTSRITVILNAQSLPTGDYNSRITIMSNDPDEPLIDVPIHLRVHLQVICGDADGDGLVSASDVVFLVSYLFANGMPPDPVSAADVTCDNKINLSDAVYLVNYIFVGGAAPCAGCK
jgi:hypothetical protein